MNKSLGFDPTRLTIARWSARLTKRDLAEHSGVSPASITQYEAGRTLPTAATLARVALALGVPTNYFERRPGRRRPDPNARSFFRSLRATPQRDRDFADALAEHVFDLVEYLDKWVTIPASQIPSLPPYETNLTEIESIAMEVRRQWNVPDGPIANVVRLLEAHGVIVVRLPSGDTNVDAFSRWFAERPLVMLWADKRDKARSRFDAAHELGHLVMHADPDPLDRNQERQAYMFASAFLMPRNEVQAYLPDSAPSPRSWPTILIHRKHWGVSAKALLFRARELGALSEYNFRRAMVSYNKQGIAENDGVELGDPETPLLLYKAVETLQRSVDDIATEASIPRALLADLLRFSHPGAN
jgi:Zn-dependent peptidase ImmA (M78 family)/DNA-binding XRE family transcriptional regulator